MNFFKNLFSGGGTPSQGDGGIYIHVQPRGCEEVIRVRLDPRNDLTAEDGGYWVRKIARGNYRCFNPVEMMLRFDANRQLVEDTITGGTLVDQAVFDAWEAELAARKQRIAEQNAAVDAENNDDE
jgi:hypothetical protein